MGHYRKIDTRIWNDQKFNELSDYGKLVFFLLLTHPHLTSIGAMRASLPGLASELRWSLEKFRTSLDESYLKSMVLYDELASFLWVPNFLKYNQPESPNVVRSWGSSLDYLPECSLKNRLISHLSSFVLTLSSTFREALPKALRKNMPNQEQEQEQEQKQEQKQEDNIMSGNPDIDSQKSLSSLNNQSESSYKDQAIEIIKFLNKKAGRAYRCENANLKLVIARLRSGATIADCRQVIVKKTREWKKDVKMSEYLRPATLFNAVKFEQYMGELVILEDEENPSQ